MHHYDNSEDGKLLARFGIHTSDDEISQVFTDETGNRRPSHEFNAAALRREGTQTGYDVVESVERSLNGVLNTIHQTGNVDRLKQFEQAINGTPKRDEMGNYVQENNKTVLESRPLYEYAADGTKLDKSYLTGFGNEIGQFSQRAANKRTGDLDRLIEKVGGRKSIGYLRLAASLRSASAVAFNPLSALTNLAPIKFLPIFCSAQETVSALASTIKQMAKDAEPDYIKAHSSFVEARTAHSPEERSVQGKVLDWGYAMSSACDKFATNFMARAMFNHEMNRNGGNGELALKQTEAWLRDVLTDKSRVGRSQFYENMTLGGIFGQFQQESVNELMYMLKDMKHYGGRIPKTLIMMIAVLAMNGLWNHLRGSDTMTDPYGAVRKAVNGFDEDDTLYDKAKGVAGALVETVNPIDFLTSGETAVTNSIKDTIESVDKLLEGEEDIWGFAATLGAMFLPGYSTAKRAYTGVKSVRQGYAETESGKVKFAIEKPNVGKAIFAAIGGVNVLEDARKYNKGESAALTKSDSETYRQLVEMGYTTTDAWNIMRNAKAASSATSEAKRTEKRVDASAGERAEAQTLAAEARESASVPADMPAWAHEEYVSGDDESPVNVGVALWRAYGVDSYPCPIIGASFKRESDGGEVMYKSADGAYYPVTEDDLGAMDREWRQAYRRTVRYYLAGDFGAVGSKEAAEGLASKLSSVRSKISSKYMDGLAANYGGETNG